MLIRSPRDVGALVRDRRKQLDLDQASLAKRAGVSRRWLIAVEKGRARAALGLVLRTLDVLGLELTAEIARGRADGPASPDIDQIVTAARKRSR